MATGNPFLGTVKGSIGDITLYKNAGKQVLRARIREIKNPKTQGQLIQRAIMKTVQNMYSAGKVIFNHSFENKSVKMGSYSQFLAVNMRQLRNDLIADVRDGRTAEAGVAAVVARGVSSPNCWSFIVSQGSLPQDVFRLVGNDGDIKAELITNVGGASLSGLTLKAFCEKLGIVEGDIFTVVTLGSLTADDAYTSQYASDLASQPAGLLSFLRLEVKQSALTDDSTTVAEATVEQLFTITGTNVDLKANQPLVNGFLNGWTRYDIVEGPFMGVIRSRKNSPLRSNCRLQTVADDGTTLTYTPHTGIKADYLLNAWVEEQDQLGASSLILEGGSFQSGAV